MENRAIAASITRMAIYIIVSYRTFSSGYDIDQTVTTMLWWSMVEAGLGLITSCLPVLSPLLRKVKFPDSLTSLIDRVAKSGDESGDRPTNDFLQQPDNSSELNWVRLSPMEGGIAKQESRVNRIRNLDQVSSA